MGEFAQLNYAVALVFALISVALFTQRKRLVTYRWWTFSLIQVVATFVLLHPMLLVLVYWQLIMDAQRVFPYPYTTHDRTSFALYLVGVACSFGVLLYMQGVRIIRGFKARKEKRN